jgi:uncharacterized protein YjbI with pentapeptide repeats
MTLIRESTWVNLLRDGSYEEFNLRAAKTPPDLENTDLRLVDLRFADLRHANMRGAYLRNADLRGCDLSEADLHGASLHSARIAGTLFPCDIWAEEIRLSVDLGVRVRARRAA